MAEVVVIFGCNDPQELKERLHSAFLLFKTIVKRRNKIMAVLTGTKKEVEYMFDYLPTDDRIIYMKENKSFDTIDNVRNSMCILTEKIENKEDIEWHIVSSEYHLPRIMLILQTLGYEKAYPPYYSGENVYKDYQWRLHGCKTNNDVFKRDVETKFLFNFRDAYVKKILERTE
jgi:hypothetical protein